MDSISRTFGRRVGGVLVALLWVGGAGAVGAEGQGALPEGDVGVASKHPGDVGVGKHPAVLFHDDFESGDTKRWDVVHHAPHVRVTAEPAHVHGGRRAVEMRVPQQSAELSNALVKTLGDGHDVVYLRYYSKFDPDFDQTGSSHNGGYLAAISPGLRYATPGVKADGRNKFTVSFENWRENRETPKPGHYNVYVYHPGQRTEFGDHFFASGKVLPFSYKPGDFGRSFVGRRDVVPEMGRWYCHELMVKANAAGKTDGRIACWLDGKLIADFPNLRLRDVETLKVNHAALDLHIGSNVVKENRKWYDDVVIATEYVGPRVVGR